MITHAAIVEAIGEVDNFKDEPRSVRFDIGDELSFSDLALLADKVGTRDIHVCVALYQRHLRITVRK